MCWIMVVLSSAGVKDAIPCICGVAAACRIVVSFEADDHTFNSLRKATAPSAAPERPFTRNGSVSVCLLSHGLLPVNGQGLADKAG